ncbi:hypothetical protein BGW41_002201 [Actinomortierella wolfii]|nr:hypothetical protein BGW41_002201 [Actinomortierella wolfii]
MSPILSLPCSFGSEYKAVFFVLVVFVSLSTFLRYGLVSKTDGTSNWNDDQTLSPISWSQGPTHVHDPSAERELLLDFIRNQWTHCTPLDATSGWQLEHCTSPPTPKACQQSSGYIRIQRLPSSVPKDPSKTTCFNYTTPGFQPRRLSNNATHQDYIAFSLGPEAFHVEMVGPERHIWVQQQILENCTYALPYHVSTPGRYWIAAVMHIFDNFEGLDDLAPLEMWPLVLNEAVLANNSDPRGRSFDVCQVAHLPPSLELYIGSHSGAYKADPPPATYEQALNVDQYTWVSRYHLLNMASIAKIRSRKASETPGQENPSLYTCLINSRRMYQYLGDSHIRVLFKSHLHLFFNLSGPVIMSHEYYFPPIKIGRMQLNYKFDNHFMITDQLLDVYEGIDDDGAYLDWVQPMNTTDDEDIENWRKSVATIPYADVLILGWGHWQSATLSIGGHMVIEDFVERSEAIFRRFLKLQSQRRAAKKRPMLLVWNGLPASTEKHTRQNLFDGDWRTNQRLAYWDRLVSVLIDRLNAEVAKEGVPNYGGPAIVKLHAFDKTLPYKAYAADFHHFTYRQVVSAQLSDMLPYLRAITGC